jgi:carbon storage regulator
MLYLTRKIGESVIINDEIILTLVEVKGRSAKIGFSFPPTATVLRQELYERIQEENRLASNLSKDLFQGISLAAPNPVPAAPKTGVNADKPTLALKPTPEA